MDEIDLDQLDLDEDQITYLLRKVIFEIAQQQQELSSETLDDANENMGMINTIQEGEQTEEENGASETNPSSNIIIDPI
ncbi:MAG: hypothetical protein EA366_08030 [Spirulina sp. DLM2.Bin59]|nr:MAG: hypothetical protein EA366_08030 [Spirulina sp. DLM2.Bin59]